MTTPQWPDDGRLERIEDKLDTVIRMLSETTGIKGFALGVLANLTGNAIDGRR